MNNYKDKILMSRLLIIPSPIGNLADITQRSVSLLSSVELYTLWGYKENSQTYESLKN